jgi:hypothetical protein
MFEISSILGLDKDEAVKLLDEAKIRHRVFSEEGESRMLTCDYDITRVNLNIVAGKVSSYNMG